MKREGDVIDLRLAQVHAQDIPSEIIGLIRLGKEVTRSMAFTKL